MLKLACDHTPHARGDEPTQARSNIGAAAIRPTHVGMNRYRITQPEPFVYTPHARGDEPELKNLLVCGILIRPTHVGMNRFRCRTHGLFPAIRPTHVGMNRINMINHIDRFTYAPRTWG